MDEIATRMATTWEALPSTGKEADRASLERAAKEFEAVFLSEMLTHAGLGAVPETFGGGVGEEGFSGMLVREYAERIAQTGRIGIAEQVFEALVARSGQ